MSVAESFTALGAGNGFPHCLSSAVPSGRIEFLTGLTRAEAMALYWNVESISVEVSVDISWSKSDGSDSGSDNWSVDSVFSITEILGSPHPKDRACVFLVSGSANGLDTGDAKTETSGAFTHDFRTDRVAFVEVGDDNITIPGRGLYSGLTGETGISIRCNLPGTSVAFAYIGSFRGSGSSIKQIRHSFNGEFMGSHVFPAYIFEYEDDSTVSGRGIIDSFTINYFRFTPNFYTYA